jgi:hypothetical protein
MLPELTPELREEVEIGVTLFAGVAEDHFGELLRAAYEDRLESVYNFMSGLPDLGPRPLPFMPRRYVRRCAGTIAVPDREAEALLKDLRVEGNRETNIIGCVGERGRIPIELI